MCKKLPYCNPRIDKCLRERIEYINKDFPYKTIASCCGHYKYKETIIVKVITKGFPKGFIFEFNSLIKLTPRKHNRYYKKDVEGYYYVPELINGELK